MCIEIGFADVFEQLIKQCDREWLLSVCEEHIEETECDEELAEFITYVLKRREHVRFLVYKELGGDKA
jgi:hypothetical protein